MATLLGMVQLILVTLPQLVLEGWAAGFMLVAVLIVFLQYRRVGAMETEIYGIAKHSPLEETQRSFFAGIFAGLLGSVAFSLAGVGIAQMSGSPSALLYLWPLSVVLGLINPRLICFSYSGSLVTLSSLLLGWPRIDVPSVLGLVAVLHLVEALLVRFTGAGSPAPVSLDRADAQPVPGFRLNRFWPVPLLLPVFGVSAVAPLNMPAWWPVLGPAAEAVGGWGLLPVVVLMGYSDIAISAPPRKRARQSARMLLGYSAVLFALALAGSRYQWLLWVGALFSGLGHELMAVLPTRLQLLKPAYLQRPGRGVGVLDVLPGSPAAMAGLQSGAVIVSVDDREVHRRQQLHHALMASPAYVSIMYRVGHQLEHCRIPRPSEGLFDFGVILLPEPGDKPLTNLQMPAPFRWSGLEK